MLSHNNGLTIAAIRQIFVEEIDEAGGTVCDTFADDVRLFSRSILRWVSDVRPRDKLQGGVALRAIDDEISVHPYLFRQVCRNGAIIAHSLHSERLERLSELEVKEAGYLLRAAIRKCTVEDAFTAATDEVRSACELQADLALNLLPLLSRLESNMAADILGQIMTRFTREGDASRFGLMNAITSVARDTAEPELRWRLEEFGGGVTVARTPSRPTPTAAAELVAAK